MASVGNNGTYRTDDLALATTLRLEGFVPDSMELRDRSAFWVFRGSVELSDVVTEYHQDQFWVHPREFAVKLHAVRKELFSFLNSKGVKPR